MSFRTVIIYIAFNITPIYILSFAQVTPAPTSLCNNIHFICDYNDKAPSYYTTSTTLSEYADLMINAILSTIDTISIYSPTYNKDTNRVGISNLQLCSIFNDVQLLNHCESFQLNTNASYTAIGTFSIINPDLNDFKDFLLQLMNTNNFRYKFTEQMNDELSNITGGDTNNFEAILIQVTDSLYYSTTQTPTQHSLHTKNTDFNTTTVIIILVIICCLAGFTYPAFMYYKKLKNKAADQNSELHEGQIQIEDNNIDCCYPPVGVSCPQCAVEHQPYQYCNHQLIL